MFTKNFLVLSLFVLVLGFAYLSVDTPVTDSSIQYSGDSPVAGPVQQKANIDPIVWKRGSTTYTLTPRATYSIEAMVARKQHYGDKWASISPYDLVLAWGPAADPRYADAVSYTQGARYYVYRYANRGPINGQSVIQNTANTHIIPANDSIEGAIRSIEKGDIVALDGYLVNVDGQAQNGYKSWWRTSMTRTDTGPGSCELFLVTEVQIRG